MQTNLPKTVYPDLNVWSVNESRLTPVYRRLANKSTHIILNKLVRQKKKWLCVPHSVTPKTINESKKKTFPNSVQFVT